MSDAFQTTDAGNPVTGALSGVDAAGQPESLPPGSKADWSLNDPDGTLAMTVSDDSLSVSLAKTGKITKTQDAQLGVSVMIPGQANPLTGSASIHVNAGALASVSIALAEAPVATP